MSTNFLTAQQTREMMPVFREFDRRQVEAYISVHIEPLIRQAANKDELGIGLLIENNKLASKVAAVLIDRGFNVQYTLSKTKSRMTIQWGSIANQSLGDA